MEQTSWNISLNTSSGFILGDKGKIEVGASTSISVSLEPATTVDMDLQLADADKLNVIGISASVYNGKIELTSNGNTYRLTGPLLLFGDLITRFSSDLSTLSIENKDAVQKTELKILIGRALV